MSAKYENICLACGNNAIVDNSGDGIHKFFECDICGRYMINTYHNYSTKPKNRNKLAHYLYYHQCKSDNFNFIGKKAKYDELINDDRKCFFITEDIIENWYPKTFYDKIDSILMKLWSFCRFYGDEVQITKSELFSVIFVNFYDSNNKLLDEEELIKQTTYIVKYLEDKYYIENVIIETPKFIFTPLALGRIDELQKIQPNNKNVFVAMSFANDMKDVREAIREAIIKAGYLPRIMDEIEHNHQIVPEMLYEIRQSKFVVAELTGHNNGAYFEAGYALGQEKEVIQICKKDSFGTDGHFDVKQINTVLWEDVNDIVRLLSERIKSTII